MPLSDYPMGYGDKGPTSLGGRSPVYSGLFGEVSPVPGGDLSGAGGLRGRLSDRARGSAFRQAIAAQQQQNYLNLINPDYQRAVRENEENRSLAKGLARGSVTQGNFKNFGDYFKAVLDYKSRAKGLESLTG